MNANRRKKLEKAGWAVGSTEEFLGLTSQESAFVEIKLALSRGLRKRRTDTALSQTELARRIGSSQSRIAKAESGDPGVSTDLLIKALLATGITPAELARMIAG